MIIMLLAMLLLASLVFYVINLGTQTNSRIVTQHSADAASTASTGYYARTFNQVARNNLGTVALIAAVDTLDAMPQATAYALEDQIALRDGLSQQMNAVRPIVRAGPYMYDKLTIMQGVLDDEISQLTELDNLFTNVQDVRYLTFYTNPAGDRGALWASMESMEQYSVLAMDSLGELSQINGGHAAQANLNPSHNETDAVVLPVVTGLACDYEYRNHADASRRTSFRDFERPVRIGLLPAREDDPIERRGPFDTVFGFRVLWPPPPGTTTTVNNGNSPVSRGDTRNNGGPRQPWNPTHYEVFGYEGWLWDHVARPLQYDRTNSWLHRIGRIKARYLWDGVGPQTVVDPEWITGWSVSEPYFDSRRDEIVESAYIAVEIRSKFPPTNVGFMNPGTWEWATVQGHETPRVIRQNAPDPRTWGITQVTESIWRDKWETFSVYADPTIGITTQYDANGDPILQPVYRVDYFIFIGVNVGDPVEVRNPHNFSSMDDLPGPIMLNRSEVNTSPASRRQWLTQMAVVAHGDHAQLWPSRFHGGKPYNRIVAVAEAEVFNDHSWDLWTPMWQSRLTSVREYDAWLDTLDTAVAAGATTQSMSTDELTLMSDFLRATQSLAPAMLNH